MPKRSRKKPVGEGEATEPLVEQEATGPSPASGQLEPPTHVKNPAAVALGKLGGAKGGVARAKKLTAKQRSDIGKKAAAARWAKKR